MEKIKIAGVTAFILYFFSLSASAQSMDHYELFYGNQFSLIKATALTNSIKIKLISEAPSVYGFDYQWGKRDRAWYLHGELLQYDFRSGSTITAESAKDLTGNQSYFEFGRVNRVFEMGYVYFKYGFAYHESLYIDTPDVSFKLKKANVVSLVFDLQLPILTSKRGFFNALRSGSGVFINMNGSAGIALGSSGPDSIFTVGSGITFRKKISDKLELDFKTQYGIEQVKTNLYEQNQTDLRFMLNFRYLP